MAIFSRILSWLGMRAENVLALLLGSMFVSFLVQVVFRYVLNLPLGWTVEWVTIAWLWGILFGYAFVVREADVIRLDILYGALPPLGQRICDVISGLIIAGVFAYTLPAMYDYVSFMALERTAFIRIPFNFIFSIYLAFVCSVSIRSLISVYHALRGSAHLYSGQVAEEHDNV
ncbi:MAG: TRAP transporter small permease [Paracoccaceae bacterium]